MDLPYRSLFLPRKKGVLSHNSAKKQQKKAELRMSYKLQSAGNKVGIVRYKLAIVGYKV